MSADVLHAYRMQVARGVRRLSTDDTDQVTTLLELLGYTQEGTDVAARMRLMGRPPRRGAFVWDERGRLLGTSPRTSSLRSRRTADGCGSSRVAVADSARGRGIGPSLVAAAETFGLMRGCHSVEVTTCTREGAHAFYKALGYQDRSDAAGRFLRQLPWRCPVRPVCDFVHVGRD